MIHSLEIDKSTTPKGLKKLARRYAMTGGYELKLSPELSLKDVERLAQAFLEELTSYSEFRGSARFKASNPYRVLLLILGRGDLSPALAKEIASKLGKEEG